MQYSKVCFIGPIRRFLQLEYDLSIEECYLYGLLKQFYFRFDYIHEDKKVSQPQSEKDWISIEGSKYDLYNQIVSSGIANADEISNSNFSAFIAQYYDENTYLVAYLDAYYLPYHPQYMTKHGETNVLLKVISDKENFMYWDEHIPTLPTSTSCGMVSISELDEAKLNKSFYALKKMHNFNINESDIFAAILENAKSFVSDSNIHSCNLAKLAEEMNDWEARWSTLNLQNVYRQGYLHIKHHGGTLVSREMYCELIKELTKGNMLVCNKELMNNSYECLEYTTQKWRKVASLMFRNSVKYSSKNSLKIMSELELIDQVEARAMGFLKQLKMEN